MAPVEVSDRPEGTTSSKAASSSSSSSSSAKLELTLPKRVFASAAAGATGAVLSTVLFYPIELVKNRLQAASLGKAGFAYNGMLDGLMSILREEGIQGWFVGIGSIASRCLVADFLTFYFSDLLVGLAKIKPSAVSALVPKFCGTALSVLLSLPLENISTRVTVSRPPLSTRAATVQLWKEGGLGAFWRGSKVMIVLCINPALTMCSFDWLRRLLDMFKRDQSKDENEAMPWSTAFAMGAIAKLLTLSLVYPLIRGKFILQGRDTGGAGLFQVLAEVRRKEGIRSWYSGLDAQMSKSLLSTALLFATKEQTEASWRRLVAGKR